MALSDEYFEFISKEAVHVLVCAVIGFLLASALRGQFRSRRKVLPLDLAVIPTSPQPVKPAAAGTFPSTLPAEIAASIANFADLACLAQVSTTSSLLREEFWNRTEVWCELCAARCLECPLPVSHSGAAAREQFRHVYFHITGDSPEALLEKARNVTNQATEVLAEAALMLRGMMPDDSASSVRCAIDAGGTALWVHAGGDAQAAHAAESFLLVASRRTDLVMPWQLEHLADALRTTRELETSMEMAMQRMINEVQGGQMEVEEAWDDGPLEEVYGDLPQQLRE